MTISDEFLHFFAKNSLKCVLQTRNVYSQSLCTYIHTALLLIINKIVQVKKSRMCVCKREKVLKFSGSVDECLINKCGISWKIVAKSVENLSKNYVRKENSMKFQVTCN